MRALRLAGKEKCLKKVSCWRPELHRLLQFYRQKSCRREHIQDTAARFRALALTATLALSVRCFASVHASPKDLHQPSPGGGLLADSYVGRR
jgi:hypothetical protein